MQVTTKAQRKALKKLFDRTPIREVVPFGPTEWCYERDACKLTYKQFRRMVKPTIGMDNAIVIPWCGMWLAIEADGYTHS